jgi:hypothetical protein
VDQLKRTVRVNWNLLNKYGALKDWTIIDLTKLKDWTIIDLTKLKDWTIIDLTMLKQQVFGF